MSRMLIVLCAALAVAAGARGDEPWIVYEGHPGPGNGRTIVLVSGDEEYRSEEALPQLGRILAVRLGFRCVVLFAVDPDTGAIAPDVRTNIPGLHHLADADLMIIATRFRDLPDEQMAHVDAYVRSGRPVVGLRTATHAFALEGSATYAHYSWNHEGAEHEQGFGRQVLGETWIAHHGAHGAQSTRGVIADAAAEHPIARGLAPGSVWGPTDVYRVRLPLIEGAAPIVLGEVLDGMSPLSPPAGGELNDPMMPIAWTIERAGPGPRRVFTTTMGAATDLLAEGTRRMIVQGALWAMGLEDAIPARGADVRLVGRYEPSPFAFGGARPGARPGDLALGPGDADLPAPPTTLVLETGDRIVVVGNTFAERLAQSGWFDALAHAAHPEHGLVIRHAPWSADAAGVRPREMNVPTMEQWIGRLDADVVFLCFGMVESLDAAAPSALASDLQLLIAGLRAAAGPRGRPPRLVLVSPIAREDLGPPGAPAIAVSEQNRRLRAIVETMRRVAAEQRVVFLDLFEFSREAYAREEEGPLTTNGIHPTERGAGIFAGAMASALGWPVDTPGEEDAAAVDALRAVACDQHWLFRLRYRPTNTEYVWGRRRDPYGSVNFPPEMAQLDRMLAARDAAIRSMAKPSPSAVLARVRVAPDQWPRTPTPRTLPEDEWTPAPVEAKGTETSLGALTIKGPTEFAEAFALPDRYVIECFASEKEFPALANPLAMAFDDRHRLWVLCTPTYPHLLPGRRPECRLLVLEDTDGDGRADDGTVFADGLYIPTGFAVDTDAVYVGQAPDLLRLADTDGDGRADTREVVLSGFGMPDSHHQLSAFEWDPTGAFLMHEGVFTKSNVETPYGVRRTDGAAVWRYDPRTGRLEILAHCYFNNPWGFVFDDYGAGILADASAGENFSFPHVDLPFEYPRKPSRVDAFLVRGRPTAGCELIASRHFPPDVQDTFLVNQSIGFHGTRWDRLDFAGSTWTAERMPRDLLESSDVNFRPVGMEVGPDGALYVLDWCNPIIGHMQYSVRDPRRDHAHGRVWRIRHRDRPLLEPPDVHRASVGALLELLRLPERNTRQLARRRLQTLPADDVLAALTDWLAAVSPGDPLYPRLVLEDLWIRHAHGRADPDLVERALSLSEPRARAGAVRVIRHLLQNEGADARLLIPLLERAVDDEDMRVRLEAVVASGFLPVADGIAVAARADGHEMDEPMRRVFDEVISYLDRDGTGGSAVVQRVRLQRLAGEALLAEPLDDLVATVRLARRDLPRSARVEALAHLAGPEPSAQTTYLLESLMTARRAEAIRSIGEMLVAMPGPALRGHMPEVRDIAGSSDPDRRAAATAIMIRQGDRGYASRMPMEVVEALALLEPGMAGDDAVAAIRRAVEHAAIEPMPGVAQVVRHERDREALRRWCVELVEGVEDTGLEPWTGAHERAMAGLRGLHEIGAWTSEHERLRIDVADEQRRRRGETLFHDEALGCARCHGARGQGLEGFPPLDRSAKLVGHPERAASIVVHGLYGVVRARDGRSYNSSMAPLGAILDDEQIAAILTYARQSWGNFAPPVYAANVAAARAGGPPGGAAWEVNELLARYPMRSDGIVPRAVRTSASVAPGEDGIGAFLRSLVIYLCPPLAAAALILWLLDRGQRRRA